MCEHEEEQQGAAVQRKGLSLGSRVVESGLCNSVSPNGEAAPGGAFLCRVCTGSLLIFGTTRLLSSSGLIFHICKMDVTVHS